jgi:hypothetical protein
MNVDLLHIEVVESSSGHAVIVNVPRFTLTIEHLTFRPRRWHYWRDQMHLRTDRTLMTPVFSLTLDDFHGREQEIKVAKARNNPNR